MSAPSERLLHDLAQLAYLDPPPRVPPGEVTVGALADYYTGDVVGEAYLRARFCGISREYEDWKQFLREGIEEYRDFRITRVLSDNAPHATGFYGCAFESGENGTVVAFRGSEMLGNPLYINDYKTNFALSYVEKAPQQQKVEEYFLAFPELAEKPFSVTGHSLGGNLAAYAALCAPERARAAMSGAHAFNAPGFNREFIAARGEEREEARLYLYQNRFDPVSSMLLDVAEPVIVESAVDPHAGEELSISELFHPHSNFAFAWEGETLRRSEQGKSAFCKGVRLFSEVFLLLPRPLREGLCGMALDALYAPASGKKELGYLLEAACKYLGRHPDTVEAHLKLMTAYYGAQLLLQDGQTLPQLREKVVAAELSMPDVIILLLKGLEIACGE